MNLSTNQSHLSAPTNRISSPPSYPKITNQRSKLVQEILQEASHIKPDHLVPVHPELKFMRNKCAELETELDEKQKQLWLINLDNSALQNELVALSKFKEERKRLMDEALKEITSTLQTLPQNSMHSASLRERLNEIHSEISRLEGQ
ncbi:hypothetical protein HK098_004663 [Nowakowskiella sp. JEL0407]|nr:hypothetical protein HK098_004663 [Nowakowskiella sp. JEL0407]